MTDLTVVHSNIYVYCFVVVAVADVVVYVFFYYYLVFYFLFFLDISDTDFWSTSQPVSREVALLMDSLIFTVLAYRASGMCLITPGFPTDGGALLPQMSFLSLFQQVAP